MKYINSHRSRNCNLHFFTSVWELWPLGHSHTRSGNIQALSSLKCVVVSYEVQNLHGRDWASPYPGINCAVVRAHAWKMGNVIFYINALPGWSPAREFRVAVSCRAELEVPGKQYCQKWKQQQSLGTSQMRWKMTGWFGDLGSGLGLLKLELDGTWDFNPSMQLAPNY